MYTINFIFSLIGTYIRLSMAITLPIIILTIPFYHILVQFHMPRIPTYFKKICYFVMYSTLSVVGGLIIVLTANLIDKLSGNQLVALKVTFIVLFVMSSVGTMIMVAYLEWKKYSRLEKKTNISEPICQKSCQQIVKQFRLSVFTYFTLYFSVIFYIIIEMGFKHDKYAKYFSIISFPIIASIEVIFVGGFVIPFALINLKTSPMHIASHILIAVSLMNSHVWEDIPFVSFIFVVSFAFFTAHYSLFFDIIITFHIENMFLAFILFFLGMCVFALSVLAMFGCLIWISISTGKKFEYYACTAFNALSALVGIILNIRKLTVEENKLKYEYLKAEQKDKIVEKGIITDIERNYEEKKLSNDSSLTIKDTEISKEHMFNYQNQHKEKFPTNNYNQSQFDGEEDDEQWDDGEDEGDENGF